MKKFVSTAAGILLAAGSIALGSTAAMAEEPIDVCVPSDTYIEIVEPVEHPAVYEPIQHEAEYTDVEHPAVYDTVEHPAEYQTVEVKPAIPEVLEQSYVEKQWKWWGYIGHGTTIWTDGSYPSKPANIFGGDWRLNGNERKVITQAYQPAVPAVYEEQLVKEAWTEEVLVTEAWTETVLVKEAYTEQKLVKEAWTEEFDPILHDAVTCPTEEVPVENTPVAETGKGSDENTTAAVAKTDAGELAETGGEAPLWILGGAIFAILGGGYLIARRIIPASHKE